MIHFFIDFILAIEDVNPWWNLKYSWFEPLERSVETIYGDDGGKPQIHEERKIRNVDDDDATTTTTAPPANPGDIKGCSDFDTYEGALRWYEYVITNGMVMLLT